ncbi:MAG: hypothetical protein ABJA84_02380 [Polaromonas sp.]
MVDGEKFEKLEKAGTGTMPATRPWRGARKHSADSKFSRMAPSIAPWPVTEGRVFHMKHEGAHMPGRQQLELRPDCQQGARPAMYSPASFKSYQWGWALDEKRYHLSAFELTPLYSCLSRHAPCGDIWSNTHRRQPPLTD